MKIDGKALADRLLADLALKVTSLKEKGITPTLAVILVGDNPDSLSYIKSKQRSADTIGAKLILHQLPTTTSSDKLSTLVQQLNNDPTVPGIIIQRPLPKESPIDPKILTMVDPKKDVDGFVPNSPFQVPVARAVLTVLTEIYRLEKEKNASLPNSVESWLNGQCVAVIGRGVTAGKPIADLFSHNGCTISVIHSQTQHPEEIIKKTPIIVSAVGKPNTVTREMVMPGSILIGVGIWWDSEGKMHGDYDEEQIQDIAAYYTPTPKGIGPLNVASLMANLVQAAQ
jgi:methylenetetrahydrofolate dehydrogenase (NADP+)/methenyltetrahydrofolate cyclohydrolase